MSNEVKSHPAFSVLIDVSHAFKFVPVSVDTEATPREPIVKHADGQNYQRKLHSAAELVDDATTVTSQIDFAANTIAHILAEREAARETGASLAKLSFNAIVAQHIQDVAMRDHSAREHWLAIRVPGDEKLEIFLNSYFEMGVQS